jgi:small subunit ribosomal protein S10
LHALYFCQALTAFQISAPKPSLNRNAIQRRCITQATTSDRPSQPTKEPRRNASQLATKDDALQQELRTLRLPKAVQATFLTPLKRTPTHGIPVCDLQLRSYSVRNLELFADFCLRAAYYLNLPAKGPVPLPKITERWTVPRSNFVHKKSQENFERVTVRRLVQIQDGHPETVALWLAYIQKNRYYGVGLKANVFEHGELEVGKDMDAEAEKIAQAVGEKMALIGGGKALEKIPAEELQSMIHDEPFKAAYGAYGAMNEAQSVPNASKRFTRVPVDVESVGSTSKESKWKKDFQSKGDFEAM